MYHLIWSCSIRRNKCSIRKNKIEITSGRDGRVVDSSGLENRYSSEQRTIEGSNPSLSFCLLNKFVSLFVWPGPFYEIKGDGSAIPPSRARTEKNNRIDINKKISAKGGHGKNRFQITIYSFFKPCCSCTGPSRMPQMPHK